MRILVTAGSGLTGTAFRTISSSLYPNHEFYFHKRQEGDLSDPSVFNSLQTQFMPEIVIHNASRLNGSFSNQESVEKSRKINSAIFQNLLTELLPSQQLYCLTSYHVFDGAAPFEISSLSSLNKSSSYAAEKSIQIEKSLPIPNAKFVFLPHLFGEGDNFSAGRAHFVANSIKRIVVAKEHIDEKIDFFGNPNRILQFSTAELAAISTLNTAIFERDKREKYYVANVGWKRSCLEVFTNICDIVGFQGLVVPVDLDSKVSERDMYFPTSTNPMDLDESAFQRSLATAIDYFMRGEFKDDL